MAERKRKQKKGFSALAVRIGLVCVCIYLCVSLVFAQIDIVSKRQQLENLTQQVAAQEAANTELQRTLDSGDEAAYMERIARDKLGYVLPGEHIYVDCHSNLTHQGAKLYNGPFYKSLRDNLSSAIGAPKGAVMKLSGLQYVPKDEL